MGFISLVHDIHFMLINSRHICIRSIFPTVSGELAYSNWQILHKGGGLGGGEGVISVLQFMFFPYMIKSGITLHILCWDASILKKKRSCAHLRMIFLTIYCLDILTKNYRITEKIISSETRCSFVSMRNKALLQPVHIMYALLFLHSWGLCTAVRGKLCWVTSLNYKILLMCKQWMVVSGQGSWEEQSVLPVYTTSVPQHPILRCRKKVKLRVTVKIRGEGVGRVYK